MSLTVSGLNTLDQQFNPYQSAPALGLRGFSSLNPINEYGLNGQHFSSPVSSLVEANSTTSLQTPSHVTASSNVPVNPHQAFTIGSRTTTGTSSVGTDAAGLTNNFPSSPTLSNPALATLAATPVATQTLAAVSFNNHQTQSELQNFGTNGGILNGFATPAAYALTSYGDEAGAESTRSPAVNSVASLENAVIDARCVNRKRIENASSPALSSGDAGDDAGASKFALDSSLAENSARSSLRISRHHTSRKWMAIASNRCRGSRTFVKIGSSVINSVAPRHPADNLGPETHRFYALHPSAGLSCELHRYRLHEDVIITKGERPHLIRIAGAPHPTATPSVSADSYALLFPVAHASLYSDLLIIPRSTAPEAYQACIDRAQSFITQTRLGYDRARPIPVMGLAKLDA